MSKRKNKSPFAYLRERASAACSVAGFYLLEEGKPKSPVWRIYSTITGSLLMSYNPDIKRATSFGKHRSVEGWLEAFAWLQEMYRDK